MSVTLPKYKKVVPLLVVVTLSLVIVTIIGVLIYLAGGFHPTDLKGKLL